MLKYATIGLALLGATPLAAAPKPQMTFNARAVRDINRKDGVLDFPRKSYVDNIVFVFNGKPLYGNTKLVPKNRVTLKRGSEAMLQIIDGNDHVPKEEAPLGPMFVIDCREVEFGMRTQDGRGSVGSREALQLLSIREENPDPEELSAFVIWISVASGEPGEYPATVRLTFRDGTKLQRDLKVILK